MNPDPLIPQAEQAEARLQALEAQVLTLQAALNQAWPRFQDSPGVAFLLNVQGRILDVNTGGVALLRSTREFLLGRNLTSSLMSSSQRTLTAVLVRVFEKRESQKGELQFASSDGEVLDMALEAIFHQGSDDTPQCHLTLTDVTAFKLAHRVLWDTQQVQERELQAHVVKLQNLKDEFQQVVLAAGRELDGTLTRAENFLTLSHRHPETPGHLIHAAQALQQTRSLLDSLKEYMQVRFLRTRLRPINLNQVLHEVLKDVQDQMTGRDVHITEVVLPTVKGDSQVLQIILYEYLSNALKFTRMQPQTRLHIRLETDDAEVRIGVEDNGIGFNMRQKEKVFELFGRLHSTDLYAGTGLGLTVVRRLCERFGGRAWAEGKVDQGATFWFAWPKEPAGK